MSSFTRALLLSMSMFISINYGFAAESSEECRQALKLESEINKVLPKKIDEATEFVSFSVNCATKVVKYTKKIIPDASLLPLGWEVRKQRQHSQLHCNLQGVASKLGWTAMDVIFDKEMNYLATLTTTPKDCSGL